VSRRYDRPKHPTSAEPDPSQDRGVVLEKARWKLIKERLADVAAAVSAAQPGRVSEVDIPDLRR
jgi:hypothetical protein